MITHTESDLNAAIEAGWLISSYSAMPYDAKRTIHAIGIQSGACNKSLLILKGESGRLPLVDQALSLAPSPIGHSAI